MKLTKPWDLGYGQGMEALNWKFIEKVVAYMGQAVAPEYEAIIETMYLDGQDFKAIAIEVRDMMKDAERERAIRERILKESN